jgi:hypothetical protein
MKFTIWHVGGGGLDLGPVEKILKLPGIQFEIYLFEIRTGDSGEVVTLHVQQDNPNWEVKKVQIGLAGKSETRDFYINKFELSSSLLKPSSLTALDNPGFSKWGGIYKNMMTWGENTELDKVVKTNVTTVDEIIKAGLASSPDVLSMDIQGAELEVMQSSRLAFKDLIAVITESEFFEIYSDQGLFDEQMAFLTDKSFRFVKFFGFQKWYPGPMVGKGFTTVTESLFIKYLVRSNQLMNTKKKFEEISDCPSDKLLRIALVAFAYERFSYFFTLMNGIEKTDSIFWKQIQNDKKFAVYFKYYYEIRDNLPKIAKNPDYFIKNPIGVNKNAHRILKVLYRTLEIFIGVFHVRGILLKIDQSKGIERSMD